MPGTIILTLFKVSATVSIIAAAIILLSPIINKTFAAKWKYWLWLALALRLMIPFSLSLPQAPVAVTVPESAFTRQVTLWQADGIANNGQSEAAAANVVTPQAGNASTDVQTTRDMSQNAPTAAAIAAFIWGAGVAVFLIYQFACYFLFKRRALRWSVPARRAETLGLFHAVKSKMPIRQDVTFLVSRAVESPLMIGLVRPVLLLPREDYGDDELTYILKHELTHFRRRDLWYKLFMIVANAIHWFNPLIWLMRRQAGADLELSCDDEVLDGSDAAQRRFYSETLFSSIKRQKGTALSTYFFGGQKNLKSRFKNILSTKKRKNGAVLLIAVLLAAALLGGLIACTPKGETDTQTTPENGLSTDDAETANPVENQPTQSDDGEMYQTDYFDFAIENRLDYMPFFTEGNAPTDSGEYLYYAFVINLGNWGDEKGTMTKDYVDSVIHAHFQVGDVRHAALPNRWNFDGETYTAVPMGINEEPIYGLSKLDVSQESDRTVYTATLGHYADNSGFIPDAEDMAILRENIAAGDLSGLTLVQTEMVSYYINDETGDAVFLSHTLKDSATEDISETGPPQDFDPDTYLANEEMVTADGVRLTMTYDDVLALIGQPDTAYENTPGVKTIVKGGYSFGFYQIDDAFPADFPLPHDGEYYLLNILVEDTCTDLLPRGIRIGDDIQSVFDNFPTQDRELKKWAEQTVYGKQEIDQPRAFLEFTTVLGSYRLCATTTTQTLNIHFDRDNKVSSVDIIFETG